MERTVASVVPAQSKPTPRIGSPRSNAMDHGIDVVIRIDATIAALYEQRAQAVAINRMISGRA